jgi:hypothetical protein
MSPSRAAAATFVGALLLLSPTFEAYREASVSIARALTGSADEMSARTRVSRARREMTDWLREFTPPTSGYYDATLDPEYGVLARWGEGHFINYEARRPAVVGNFGDDLGRDHFLLARSFYEASPERAIEILETLRARYVVIRSRLENRPMAQRLFFGDGSLLGRFRLLYEVTPLRGSRLPSYKVFEFVEGAELVGRAPVGATVVAKLDLTTNLGRHVAFESRGQAAEDGLYRLRLPHPTTAHPPSIRPADAYRVSLAGAGDSVETSVVISEAEVQRGERIAGPDF